jgi:hypothetical protein
VELIALRPHNDANSFIDDALIEQVDTKIVFMLLLIGNAQQQQQQLLACLPAECADVLRQRAPT